jgi:DNA adenine methylase
MRMLSPFKYPGGKTALAPRIVDRALPFGTVIEPFVGGGAVMCRALDQGLRVVVNDLDPGIAAFWSEVFTDPSDLIELIRAVPANVHLYTLLKHSAPADSKLGNARSVKVAMAFKALYVRRLSFHGAGRGILGGYDQTGPWRLDHRYNPENIIARIEQLHARRGQVLGVYNEHWLTFMRRDFAGLAYLDPPYVTPGPYFANFTERHHRALAWFLHQHRNACLISYDDHPLIRELYSRCPIEVVKSGEVLIHKVRSRQKAP